MSSLWFSLGFPMELTAVAVVGLLAIAVAYKFEFANGFHDAAHACGTMIASGAMKYWHAVILVAVCNFVGAYTAGTAVAMFITKIVAANAVSIHLILAALVAGTIWNVWTWYKGIPVSSTHCLVGALVGAGIASAGIGAINQKEFFWAFSSLFVAPFVGYSASWVLGKVVRMFVAHPESADAKSPVLKWLMVASGCAVGYGHGANDGQKTMGIVTLILATAFGYSLSDGVPHWVTFTCAACIGLGTAVGAGRIIHTIQHKLVTKPITVIDGFVAQTVTAFLVLWGSKLGLPLSTTQTCTSSVLGASAAVYGENTLNVRTSVRMVLTWFGTFATAGVIAALAYAVIVWVL